MSGKQPMTMLGAGLQAQNYVALGLEGSQRVAFVQQCVPAAGAVDVLTRHILESEGEGISGTCMQDHIWKFAACPGHLARNRVPVNPGNTRKRNHSNQVM